MIQLTKHCNYNEIENYARELAIANQKAVMIFAMAWDRYELIEGMPLEFKGMAHKWVMPNGHVFYSSEPFTAINL